MSPPEYGGRTSRSTCGCEPEAASACARSAADPPIGVLRGPRRKLARRSCDRRTKSST